MTHMAPTDDGSRLSQLVDADPFRDWQVARGQPERV
jgi:hypothetical protein